MVEKDLNKELMESEEPVVEEERGDSLDSSVQEDEAIQAREEAFWEKVEEKASEELTEEFHEESIDGFLETQGEMQEPIKGERLKKRSEEKGYSKFKKGKKDKADKNDGKGLPKKEGKGFGTLKTWQKILVILAGLFIIGCIVLFTAFQVNRVDISGYVYTPKEKTQVFSADGEVIAELFTQNRTYITLDQVPQDMINAIIATEDARFYTNNGIDLIGIMRSLVGNVLSFNATGQGGSTITQQLARTLLLPNINTEQSSMDSIKRKLKEISIATQMNQKYNKNQIMEMYLNETYFGSGAYGIEEAAETYFGKTIGECNLAECAMLAGLPQAPSAYAPNNDFEAAKARQSEVLDRMVDQKYITREQADEARNTEIVIMPWSPEDLEHQIESGYGAFVQHALLEYAKSKAPEIVKQQGITEEEAIDQIYTELISGGYKIYTTVDTRFQDNAVNVVSGQMENYGYEFTGALVTVEADGAIRAYYGGNTAIDMADTPRQPGSGIKPLYYSCAFERGVATPYTTVEDSPTTFYGTYSPQNSHNSYSGNITFEQALVESSNVCSVKLFDMLGPGTAVDWMKTMGITTFTEDDYNLATAIGGMTHGIKPLEMAGAYNTFNNSGVYNQPYAVTEIRGINDETIFTKDGYHLDSHRVMSEETASTMWSILQKVVRYGTGTAAGNSLPTAGKTGTTDSSFDLWFNGMTSAYTTSIWCGSLDNIEMYSTSNMVAGLYGAYMQSLYYDDVVTE